MIQSMLTTVDNPYDPFDSFDEWFNWDSRAGYHTPGFLARLVVVSDQMSEADYNKEVERAIDEIVEENVLGVFRKVQRLVEAS